MIMKAFHIIGLTNLEYGRAVYAPDHLPEVIHTVRARFHTIRQSGRLSARAARPNDEHGHSFWQDELAGDTEYVFLSLGERYSKASFPKDIIFGFIFNAEQLILDGALLGIRDLANEYDQIIGDVAEHIAATLPRCQPISEKALAEFQQWNGGGSPELLAFIRQESSNPEHDLLSAIQEGDLSYPGCAQARQEICRRMAYVQQMYRLQGQKALEYMQQIEEDGRCEILVKSSLFISEAIGLIKGGMQYDVEKEKGGPERK